MGMGGSNEYLIFACNICSCHVGSYRTFFGIGGHIGFAPMEICFLRSAFAVILLGLFFAVTDRKIFKLEKITDLKYFVGTGIISFSLNNWAYIESIKETSMGVAVFYYILLLQL